MVELGVVVFEAEDSEAEDSEEAPQVFEWVILGPAELHLGELELVE